MCYLNQVKHSKTSTMFNKTQSVLCFSTHVKQNANNDEYLSNQVTYKTINDSVLINLSIVH